MKITKLRCDYMENPLGFDFDLPQLSWVVEEAGRNRKQSAYHLQVDTDPSFATPLFDTGKRASDLSVGYRLELPLSPRTRYYWRVCVWDDQGDSTGFSDAAFFETGRYGETWDAQWIGWEQEFPQLRKGFRIEKPVRSARAYACGVGLYRLFLNGEEASEELLAPGFNAYDLWLQYQTYDLTKKLQPGDNAIGAWLGNGYYKGRVNWPSLPHREHIYGDQLGFIAELHIEYQDGSREVILTDTSWKVAKSPYLRAEIYDGEIYDARAFQPDWCRGGFDDTAWAQAQPVNIDKGLLQARRSVPVQVTERLLATKIVTPKGEQVLDFGQNISGRLHFRTTAPAGTEIHIQFGEALDQDGNFYRDNMRTALAELRYIADGREADYAAQFTFYGFRYARVTGLADVRPQDFTGEVMHSVMERTGWFECSDSRVNRLFENALWGQRDNFVDSPTDCPQRDERMGWTGDAQVFCPTAVMNMDCDAFYHKYLYDLAVEQKKVGYVPVVVPNIIHGTGLWEFPTTGWGDAAVLMPWFLYLYYGDQAILESQYESMKDWVDYIQAQGDTARTGIYGGFHLGDWLAQDTKDPDNLFGLTPTSLVATAFYAWSAAHLAKAARVLGYTEDARHYADLAEFVRAAFRREYVSPSGRVCAETQTAFLLALHMDMLLPEQRPVAIRCLAERIVADNVQLTTGFLGTPYLCPVLSEAGLDEYAYALLLQDKCPSWLFEVKMGATTVWERWNSVHEDGTFGPVSMNSLNHYAFGAVVEWLYRYVAGLNPTEDGPGFHHTLVAPRVNNLLTHAAASIRTPYGMLRSAWQLNAAGQLELEVEVPFNATATIVLPDAAGSAILENGAPLQADGTTRLERGSGVWRYAYTPNRETIARRVEVPVLPPF